MTTSAFEFRMSILRLDHYYSLIRCPTSIHLPDDYHVLLLFHCIIIAH